MKFSIVIRSFFGGDINLARMNVFETEPDVMMSRLQRGAMYLVTWKEVEMPFGGIVMLPSKMEKHWPVPSALFEHLDTSRAFCHSKPEVMF